VNGTGSQHISDSGRVRRLQPLWRVYVGLAAPLAIVILAIGGLRLALLIAEAAPSPGAIGIDYTTVMDAAHRWLAGSSPYLARQLNGPYPQIGANLADSGEMLYPPIALPFFAAFSALPGFLWWVIPAALAAMGLRRARPARWAWPILALCLVVGQSVPLMIAGNPTIWIVVAGLWAPSLGWPGPLMLLKPSVAPLALLGIRHRSWWVAAAILAAASLVFGRLWVDWFWSVTNLRVSGAGGILFSLHQLPILLIPVVVAVAARPRTRKSATEGGNLGHEPAST
jgi:hypothetical protein